MMAGRGIRPDAAGGPASHLPVMLREVLSYLAPRGGSRYIDATFGAGGYSRGILEAANCKVVAIDRDQSAIAAGVPLVEKFEGRLTLVENRFSQLDRVACDFGFDTVDAAGVQLAELLTARAYLEADIEKAVAVDGTRGGVAILTDPQQPTWDPPVPGTTRVYISMPINVKIRRLLGVV